MPISINDRSVALRQHMLSPGIIRIIPALTFNTDAHPPPGPTRSFCSAGAWCPVPHYWGRGVDSRGRSWNAGRARGGSIAPDNQHGFDIPVSTGKLFGVSPPPEAIYRHIYIVGGESIVLGKVRGVIVCRKRGGW